MLRKLLKYDLRSMLKSFLLIWGCILVISLVNHFTLNSGGRLAGALGTISSVIPMLVYIGIFIAMLVLTLLFIIQRFYNGLLRDEGYLMFTLPVRPWQLITSKGISAVVVTLCSALVGFASILLIMDWSSSREFLTEIARLYQDDLIFTGLTKAIFTLEAAIVAILTLAKAIYQIYASIALGHLFRRRRVGMAFVMYIVITVVLCLIASLVSFLAFGAEESLSAFIQAVLRTCGAAGSIHLAMLPVLLITLVQLVIFHIITERVLRSRLNLE